jgi:hypothetical protein
MDEITWLSCADPDDMLQFLQGKVSDRKLRLFACACCRRIWDLIPNDSSRQAVRISERFADSEATIAELEAAFVVADRAVSVQGGLPSYHAADAARLSAHPEMRGLADGTATAAAMAGAGGGEGYWDKYNDEKACQCNLFGDLVGNPFRPVTIHPVWLTSTVVSLAQSIYDNRRFEDMPILADGLEDAGCDNAEMLEHARSGGEHVRGGWLVDLLLQKE